MWLAPEVILSLYNSVILIIVYPFCTRATFEGRLNFKRDCNCHVMHLIKFTLWQD